MFKRDFFKSTFFDIFYHAWTLMQRTKLTMTSKASNLNAGLNRLVWKEGDNSTPTDF